MANAYSMRERCRERERVSVFYIRLRNFNTTDSRYLRKCLDLDSGRYRVLPYLHYRYVRWRREAQADWRGGEILNQSSRTDNDINHLRILV